MSQYLEFLRYTINLTWRQDCLSKQYVCVDPNQAVHDKQNDQHLHYLLFIFWPLVYNKLACSTQMSMKFFLLINVKMPTIVGISTFLSRKNNIIGLSEPKMAEFLGIFILMSI